MNRQGKLFVVGIGPGGEEHLTPAARRALECSEVVVGYRPYLELVAPLVAEKRTVSSGMRQEQERCREALRLTREGRTVSLVSSGDAGVYGMAGLALEMAEADRLVAESSCADIEVEVVPGLSAVQAAAARLGAPLMHDFAVVSLSDLLTPWELICRRLEAAASADFVLALYNPRSRGRREHFGAALKILRRHRAPQTPVGIVRNACREGESLTLATLGDCPEEVVDMLSVVIIGNASTFVDGAGRMVTPRGYQVRRQESGGRIQAEKLENLEPGTWNLEPAPQGRALFIGGTGSDVGKSVIAAGLCRILKRRGFDPAPFKAQNMALNSAVTPEGGEIGRAQALQAAACGLAPHTDMNPVLLKPNSETGSQVIIQGRPVGNMSVAEYHRFKGEAFARVRESFLRLSAAHRVVVMEGAGSIAEINLKEHDITNLRAAAMARAPVLLVADIDRGGVFAAIAGTIALLEPRERDMIAGVVINRFRGDPTLLKPGIDAIEERTGVPVLGVVPWIDLRLPEEDSVALARKGRGGHGDGVRIGVVRLPRLSNYTDFDPLEGEPGVSLRYVDRPEEIPGLDLLILPGSKSTVADLLWLREQGLDRGVLEYYAGGGRVAGICGGYQMLGHRVLDPQAVESAHREGAGLGLLDVETELHPSKETVQAEGTLLDESGRALLPVGGVASGYEIHMGRTTRGPGASPLMALRRISGETLEDGAVSPDGRVWGTYLHGFFDASQVRLDLLAALRAGRGLPEPERSPRSGVEAELDRLADHLEKHLDLQRILALVDRRERAAV